LSKIFSKDAFTFDYCGLKTKVFYSYLQIYGTTQAMRPNCSNFQILLVLFSMAFKNMIRQTSHWLVL